MSNLRVRTREEQDFLYCVGCMKEHPKEDFPLGRPYADGSPRRKSRCRPSAAKMARARAERIAEDKILFEVAPRLAAQKLLDLHPEERKSLAKKYPYDYISLLTEERKRLLELRQRYMERLRRSRVDYYKDEKDAD